MAEKNAEKNASVKSEPKKKATQTDLVKIYIMGKEYEV